MNAPALQGPHKAAVVLLALGEDVAAEVIKHLDEEQVMRLREHALRLGPDVAKAIDSTCEEFEKLMKEPVLVAGKDPQKYLKGLTARAFGRDRAERLFADREEKPTPMQAIKQARPATVGELLEEEHPQIAAAIASQLPRAQAAQIIQSMRPEKQSELLGRIASLKEVPQEVIDAASAALAKALDAAGALTPASQRGSFDGIAFAAGLLNELGQKDSDRILGEMQDRFAPVTAKVREAMFTFDDLSRLNTRAMQTLMREVPAERMLIALKTAAESLREQFLGAVSSRAAEAMRDDLAVMAPMRLSEVEAAQREIVEIALRLAGEGKIVLPGGAGEKLV